MAETKSPAGASGRLHLVVVSRERKLIDTRCEEATLPGREGDLGILPGHAALIATLRPGELSYRSGGATHRAIIAAGFCQVFDDTVTVLVDRAQLPEEIDLEAARAALREVERRLPFAEPEELDELQDRQREHEASLRCAG
jgi:F-type H+-transporting ATPase subunit epsilon